MFFKENAGAAAGIYVLTMYSMLACACVCVVTSDVCLYAHVINMYVDTMDGTRARRCHGAIDDDGGVIGFPPVEHYTVFIHTHVRYEVSYICFLCLEVCRKTYRLYRVGVTLCADGDFVPRRTGDQTGLNRSNFVYIRGNLSTGRTGRRNMARSLLEIISRGTRGNRYDRYTQILCVGYFIAVMFFSRETLVH